MADKLSWDEIKKRYPDEWVVLVDYVFDENEDLTQGVVFAHGREQSEVYGRLRETERPNPIAVRYTGEIRGGLIGFYAEDVGQKA